MSKSSKNSIQYKLKNYRALNHKYTIQAQGMSGLRTLDADLKSFKIQL